MRTDAQGLRDGGCSPVVSSGGMKDRKSPPSPKHFRSAQYGQLTAVSLVNKTVSLRSVLGLATYWPLRQRHSTSYTLDHGLSPLSNLDGQRASLIVDFKVPVSPNDHFKHERKHFGSFCRQPIDVPNPVFRVLRLRDDALLFKPCQSIGKNIARDPFTRLLERAERAFPAKNHVPNDEQTPFVTDDVEHRTQGTQRALGSFCHGIDNGTCASQRERRLDSTSSSSPILVANCNYSPYDSFTCNLQVLLAEKRYASRTNQIRRVA